VTGSNDSDVGPAQVGHGSDGFRGRLNAFSGWAKRVGLARKLTVLVIVAALASALATYAAWTGWTPLGTRVQSIVFFLQLDAALFLIVFTIVTIHIVRIWMERRRGAVGSRLHTRLVLLFSLVAITPTVIVAISSAVVFSLSVEAWFNNLVRTALNESDAIANAYVEEHSSSLRGDVLALANEFSRSARRISDNPEFIQTVLAAQASLRDLDEAVVRSSRGRLFARWSSSGFILFGDPVPEWAMEKVRETGGLVIFRTPEGDSIRALIKLEPFVDAYLDVSRKVAPEVLSRIDRTRRAVERYNELEGRRSQIEITLATMFVFVSLMLLMAAVWVGLVFASRLAKPISELVNATEGVRGGDLSVRVDEASAPDELGTLSRAFNRMAQQIGAQRDSLVEANRQLDDRRHFIETVLSGVSSGVVGLDRDGKVNVINRAAGNLLFGEENNIIGRDLVDLIPECKALFAKAVSSDGRQVNGEINLKDGEGNRTFVVRISPESSDVAGQGYVATFDDVTELVAAQRKAAWSDVARRIAHEIKNPLTPIQLAAERLRRKYTPQIGEDVAAFEDCTETIVRHVSDIGRLVDEFSSFARMPAPVMASEDLVSICREAQILFQTAHRDIAISLDGETGKCPVLCDRGQIGQAMTNLIQNAIDAISVVDPPEGGHAIGIFLECSDDGSATVSVSDTGKGLPDEDRERLMEPYVTTREKGTGLGLAIVGKIMEDHGGEVRLQNRPDAGAVVSLHFPSAAVFPGGDTREGLVGENPEKNVNAG